MHDCFAPAHGRTYMYHHMYLFFVFVFYEYVRTNVLILHVFRVCVHGSGCVCFACVCMAVHEKTLVLVRSVASVWVSGLSTLKPQVPQTDESIFCSCDPRVKKKIQLERCFRKEEEEYKSEIESKTFFKKYI